ncbi:hypothetical protein [Yoonia sp. BS5-3]|uniref:Flagellar hook-length control protein FliK n=1 Tax=Yoonia phaeophyticola TaxID=3137369 RepID=A0ABZ2V4T5_9RHOB
MTTINGQPQVPPVVTNKDSKPVETKSGDFLNRGATQHQRGQTNHGAGGHGRSNSSVLVSQNALEQLLDTPEQPRHSGQQDTDDTPGRDTGDDQTHVLVTLTPEKAAAKEAPVLQAATAANQQIKTDEIAKLVSRQMDAALRSGPVVTPLPVSLSIPLDASTGLKEVQVVMNEGVLTVTVVRGVDQAAHDIKQAALNLAQILQNRYPAKTIKVAQRLEDAADPVEEAGPTQAKSGAASPLLHFLSSDKDKL